MPLYKVLDGRQSVHGEDVLWNLPGKDDEGHWIPGGWVDAPPGGKLAAISDPYRELHYGREAYIVEWAPGCSKDRKRARLLRPIDYELWWRRGVELGNRIDAAKIESFLNPRDQPDASWIHTVGPGWASARKDAILATRTNGGASPRSSLAARLGRRLGDRFPDATLTQLERYRTLANLANKVSNLADGKIWGRSRELGLDPDDPGHRSIRDDFSFLVGWYAHALMLADLDPELEALLSAYVQQLGVWEAGFCVAADLDGVLYTYSSL